jgi:FKBP-type peptidyl-prolyl cis-trans isomerase FklB
MKKHRLAIAVALVGLALTGCDSKKESQAEVQLNTPEQKASYGIGLQMGSRLAQDQTVKLDGKAIALGLDDGLANKDSRIKDEDLEQAFTELRKISEDKLTELNAAALESGKKYLEENGKREGVVTTESGLQYEVLQKAEAEAAKPKQGDTVSVNYVGKLPDGTVFDDSAKHGGAIELPVNEGVIAGWLEGLQLMQVGEKFRLYVPSDLAYGPESPSPIIPANSVLVFDLELVGIKDAETQAKEAAAAEQAEAEAEAGDQSAE